jgi:LL-diaminopimelate aminotransferase
MSERSLFAERIGGHKFGQPGQTFKFTLIDDAKRAFAAKYPDIKLIDMGVGEPEELTGDNIIARLGEAARERANRIYPCNGVMPFRESAARYLKRLLRADFDPATEIMHCIGTKTALAQIPLAFCNPGDAVIATEPGYPVLPKMCTWLGADVIQLPLHRRHAFLPDLAELEEVVRKRSPKLLLLNYPNNPTGATATREFMTRVVELAQRYGFVIVQDAAYADYVFDGEFHSPLTVPGGRDVCLELYSLSKSYNMQGYRLGFVAGGAPLVKAFALVKDNTDNGQFIAIQMAGVEALDNSRALLDANRARYRRRLERTAAILTAAGIPCQASPSTFYLYVPVPEVFQGRKYPTAQAMADDLITRFGLVTVPWDEAGPHLRFSMTFEVGTRDFADEDAVFAALESRLVHGKL